MSDNYDDNESNHQNEFDDEKAWRDYRIRTEDEKITAVHLTGKDYLALFIASLQTIFLPLIILILVLFGLTLLLSALVG